MISQEDQQVPEPVLIGSRTGGLEVYGPGTDGDVIVMAPISLERDMYYDNLTLLSGAQIDTNGYRIFVKDTLHMSDPNTVIGRLSQTESIGTLMGGATSGVKASDTLGGDGGLNVGENFFGETEFYSFSSAIAGYKFDAIQNEIRFLMGGSGGTPGIDGDDGDDGTSPSIGDAGQPGIAGSPGNRPGFENSVGTPGGRGATGNPGSPGNAGVGGIGGSGGAAGIGGTGGGVLMISARNITGLGIIRADGNSPIPPQPGQPGFPGTPGTQGDSGTQGEEAPDFFQGSYNFIVNYAFTVTNSFPFTNNPYPFPTSWTNFAFVQTSFSNTFISGYNTFPFTYERFFRFNGFYRNSVFVSSNNFPTRGGNPFFFARTNFGFNPGQSVARTTRGPARVRFRTTFTFVPGNPFSRTTFAQAFNPLTFGRNPSFTYFNPPAPFSNPPTPQKLPTSNFGTNFSSNPAGFSPVAQVYNYTSFNPGNSGTNFGSRFVPQENAFVDSIFHTGGAGGAGGEGGAGAIATSGLPGTPGVPGYAGGGGVVLLVTEKEPPSSIEVRAAAGSGDGGFATAGTVIIIKNEEEVV